MGYVKYIGFFVSLFIYGTLIHNYKGIGAPTEYVFGFVFSGILKAIAGISLGAIAFELASKLKEKNFSRGIFTIIEVVLLFSELYLMHLDNAFLDQIEIFEIFIIFFIIVIIISGKSLTYGLLDNKLSLFLGKFSMVLFMNHFYWAKYLDSIIIKFQISFLSEWYNRVIAVVLLSIATSIIVYR